MRKTKITGFHQDEDKDWVADLSCGHSRHFRHDPPWQQREWVTSPQGRKTYIGFELDCKTCGSPDVEQREMIKNIYIKKNNSLNSCTAVNLLIGSEQKYKHQR